MEILQKNDLGASLGHSEYLAQPCGGSGWLAVPPAQPDSWPRNRD